MNFRERATELVSKMTLEEKLSQMNHDAPAIERLGIPAYNWWSECLHGAARNGTATVFPQSIAMAASFNKERMREVATAISDEIRAKYNENKKQGFTEIYQGITMCSPNINIFRDPRWGRGQETYGEDPSLTGMMAAEYVKGLQGDGKYRKVDATLKHYAVHSGPEADRRAFDIDVTDEELYGTYLAAFEYCIKNAEPSAVMAAYNAVKGSPCVASRFLLRDTLRDKFGFEGYVESDANGVEYLDKYHKVTNTSAESAALAVKSGCDLCIGDAFKELPAAYEQGFLTERDIDEAVIRLFTARFRLGMFSDDCEYDNIPYDVVDCEKHKALNLQMARESIVLLKNDGILPLDASKKIAVIGPCADDIAPLLANYCGRASEYVTLLSGIREKADNVMYAKGSDYCTEPREYDERLDNEALIIAEKCDVIIMCMGITPAIEGEEVDGNYGTEGGDKRSIEIPEVQKKLYRKLRELGKPMIFVNVSGSCLALGEQDNDCNAVLQCFYPGALGGRALADIIFGVCSPSGRLPVTFYASDSDLPDFRDYSMENRTYKFFSGKPVYPFGHGLTYSEITEEWTDDNTAVVTNKGSY
ncbi:MAG: glycoside hydrolase family 3 C-terminal domain-containing protein, partial [Oscillospiraceae bacterium]|nr:glycoside hydrolase family 3 C-terminal domain-containing protein [Oscillospiraceae bacterium]